MAIATDTFKKILLELFSEAYEGPNHDYTWFIGNEPGSGLFGTLETLSAEDASVGKGGTTVAAHAEHLRWSLARANAFTRGETPQAPWSESWLVSEVNEAEWQTLASDLKGEYETLYRTIQTQQAFPDERMLTGLLALAPHAAYHLGAIRQMTKTVKARRES